MIKILLFLTLATYLVFAESDDLSDCKCWDGYQARKTSEGNQCVGRLLLHNMPCNVVERPKCECSGDVTGILSDVTGTYCVQYKDGQERKKWSCENKEEWNKFLEEYPDQKPKDGEK